MTPRFASELATAGLDLVGAFAITATDDGLDRFGRDSALGLVIGNTRALWPRFRAAYRAQPALQRDPDPLDRYVEQAVERATQPWPVTIYWAHRSTDRGYVPIQQLAVRARLATMKASGLCVHPVYGPWIALRAVLAVDAPPPTEPAPAPTLACDCAHGCAPVRAALDESAARFAPGERGWEAWLALRDACPLGREHRYSEEQVAYHYTRDRRILDR